MAPSTQECECKKLEIPYKTSSGAVVSALLGEFVHAQRLVELERAQVDFKDGVATL